MTGIQGLKDFMDANDFRVNLAGQRLSKPTKGINIVDGSQALSKEDNSWDIWDEE